MLIWVIVQSEALDRLQEWITSCDGLPNRLRKLPLNPVERALFSASHTVLSHHCDSSFVLLFSLWQDVMGMNNPCWSKWLAPLCDLITSKQHTYEERSISNKIIWKRRMQKVIFKIKCVGDNHFHFTEISAIILLSSMFSQTCLYFWNKCHKNINFHVCVVSNMLIFLKQMLQKH